MFKELLNILENEGREPTELEKMYLEASQERSRAKNTLITYDYMVDDNYCLEVALDDNNNCKIIHISYCN